VSASLRRFSPVAMALLVGLGAATAACGLVVGAGDYVVGGAHDGGPTVAPGDADNDAQPVTPPDAVAPGSDATPTPDTGAPPPDDGSTMTSDSGPTTGCPPGSLPTADPAFQQLVKACLLAVSCDPLLFPVTVSQCIATDHLDTHFVTKCLASITSCADYYACEGTRIATLSECAGASSSGMDIGSCNGAVATNCRSTGDGTVFNCAALGGTCTVYHEADYASFMDTGAGCQILSSCSDPTDGSVQCSGGSGVYTCVATDTTTNLGMVSESCAAGSTCSTSGPAVGCFATTTACTAPGTTCSGGNLTTCEALSSGNEQYTSACSVAGLACTASSGVTAAACEAPGCANSGCTESCLDATHLQACIGGAPYVVDCAGLGFNVCSTGTFSNTEYHYCTYQ
jgi:hypothetical protein